MTTQYKQSPQHGGIPTPPSLPPLYPISNPFVPIVTTSKYDDKYYAKYLKYKKKYLELKKKIKMQQK